MSGVTSLPISTCLRAMQAAPAKLQPTFSSRVRCWCDPALRRRRRYLRENYRGAVMRRRGSSASRSTCRANWFGWMRIPRVWRRLGNQRQKKRRRLKSRERGVCLWAMIKPRSSPSSRNFRGSKQYRTVRLRWTACRRRWGAGRAITSSSSLTLRCSDSL